MWRLISSVWHLYYKHHLWKYDLAASCNLYLTLSSCRFLQHLNQSHTVSHLFLIPFSFLYILVFLHVKLLVRIFQLVQLWRPLWENLCIFSLPWSPSAHVHFLCNTLKHVLLCFFFSCFCIYKERLTLSDFPARCSFRRQQRWWGLSVVVAESLVWFCRSVRNSEALCSSCCLLHVCFSILHKNSKLNHIYPGK